MWQYSIQRHQDNDYDLIITILPENVEFGSDLFSAERKESVQRSLQSLSLIHISEPTRRVLFYPEF